MARNGAGVYSLPAGSTVTNGDTSDATDINTPLSDLETDMNTPRPVVAGGTGASSAAAARTNLGLVIGTDVQAHDADLASWAGVTRASGFDTFAATPSSANLRSLLTDETGTGAALFAGGDMGTPSALVLTNATGLTTAGVAAATLVTESDTIASNDNDTTIPTSAAVKAYADAAVQGTTVGLLTTTGAATVGPWDLPAGVKQFTITSNKSSLSGTGDFLVQLRVGGSFVTSGYESESISGSTGNVTSTAGMIVSNASGTNYWRGSMVCRLHDPATNLWICEHTGSVEATASDHVTGAGSIALAGAVDGVRLNSTSGTYDVSSFNVTY